MIKLLKVSAIITVLSLTSCGKDLPDREEVKQRYYDAKVSKLIRQREKVCRQDAIEAAQAEVDSLMDRWINATLFDTLNFPNKPSKPTSPGHIIDKVSKFDVEGKDG